MAQRQLQISGKITDNQNKPLASATFSLSGGDPNNSVIVLETDSTGSYHASNLKEGNYKILASFINYENQVTRFFLHNDTTINFQLNPLQQQLKDVIVTGKKQFIEYRSNKITINVAASPVAAGDNAYSVLLRGPGVVEQNGSLSFRAKSVTVLIDGRATHMSDEELKEMLQAMPASNIEKVEIIPNPSAKYDAQNGSVINIILARNKSYGFNGTIITGIGGGTYLKHNEGLNLNYRNYKINIYGGYDFSHSKQYYNNNSVRVIDDRLAIFQNEHQLVTRNNHSYKAGFDWDPDKKNSFGILFKGNTIYRKRTVQNNSSLVYSTAFADSASTVGTTGNAMVFNPSVNMYYKARFDSLGKELSFNADYFNYNKKWADDIVTDYFDEKGIRYQPSFFLRNNSPAVINTNSFSLDYVHPTAIGKFETGLKTQFTKSDNNILWQQLQNNNWETVAATTNHFIYKENVNAVYLDYSKTFTHYSIVLGARAEQTNTSGNLVTGNTRTTKHYINLFPNLSWEYVKNLNNVFDISYRQSIQRFGFNIVNPFVVYQSQYAAYQGNPHIQPEIDHNIEISYTYKQAFIFGASYTHGVKTLAPVYLKGDNSQVISTYDNLKSSDLFYVYADCTYPLSNWWTSYVSAGTGFLKYNTSTSSSIGQSNSSSWSYLLQTQNTFKFSNTWNAELNATLRGPYASGIYKAAKNFNSSLGNSKLLFNNRANIKFSVQDIFNTDKQILDISYQGIVMNVTTKTESRFLNIAFTYKFGNKYFKPKKDRDSKIDDVRQRVNN